MQCLPTTCAVAHMNSKAASSEEPSSPAMSGHELPPSLPPLPHGSQEGDLQPALYRAKRPFEASVRQPDLGRAEWRPPWRVSAESPQALQTVQRFRQHRLTPLAVIRVRSASCSRCVVGRVAEGAWRMEHGVRRPGRELTAGTPRCRNHRGKPRLTRAGNGGSPSPPPTSLSRPCCAGTRTIAATAARSTAAAASRTSTNARARGRCRGWARARPCQARACPPAPRRCLLPDPP